MTRYLIAAAAGITLALQDGPRLLHVAAALTATNLIIWLMGRLTPNGDPNADA